MTRAAAQSEHDTSIAALSSEWRALAAHFDTTTADAFGNALDLLLDHPDAVVSDAATELAAYFASFAEGLQIPTRGQLQRIADWVNVIETGVPLRGKAPSAAVAANAAEHDPPPVPASPVATVPSPGSALAPVAAQAEAPGNPSAPAIAAAAAPSSSSVTALSQSAARPTQARSTIVLFGIDEQLAPGLADTLRERGLSIERFDGAEALLAFLSQTVPAALLFEVHRLRALPRVVACLGDARIGSPLGPALVVISPNRDVSSRLLAQRAAAQAFFAAPIDGQRVAAQLTELLGREELPPARALIVMSNANEAGDVARALAAQGLIARISLDAHSAYKASLELRPDLALIDADLPDTSGAKLARMLREEPQFATLPVILLSAAGSETDRYDALMAGADEVLAKPVKSRHLAAVVESRLRQARWLKTQTALAAVRDPSSGLYRRSHLLEKLATTVPSGSALLFVAIDRAEQAREALGLMGLAALEEALARALRETLAATDCAANYRDGAYLVLATRSQRSDLDALAERIRVRLSAVGRDGALGELRLAASIGIAPMVAGESVDARVARAEAAALAAARLGGDRALWHDAEPQSLSAAEPRVALRVLLARPLPEDGVRIAFRPLVALAGKLSGQFDFSFDLVSAGESGAAAPYATWAPIAHEIGALETLERRRFSSALAARDRALQRGRQVRLFMPILSESIAGTGLVDWLLGELGRRKLSGAGLALEFSSADLVDRRTSLVDPLGRLRKVGVRIGVSDYGRDFAAIHLLSQEPVEHVRLEPELVRWTQGAHAVAAALMSLVRKAHRQGAAVLAPGVERVEQAQILQRLGIDYGAGDGLGAASSEPEYDFQRALW